MATLTTATATRSSKFFTISQLILQTQSRPTPFSAVHLWYACTSGRFLHHPTKDSSRYVLTSSHPPANSSCYLVRQCSGPLSAHAFWQVPCPGLLVPVTFPPSLKGSGWQPCREGPLLSSKCLPCSLPLSSRGSSHALLFHLLSLLRALFSVAEHLLLVSISLYSNY